MIAGVRREIPPYVLLRDEGLELIEARTDQLLKEVGVEFRGDQRALQLWREAGADVNGPRVRFDPGHVRSIIDASAPRSFVQHARNPERSVLIGENNVVFAPAYGMPFVRDLDRGRRYGLQSFENWLDAGELDSVVRANHKWKQLLADYEPPPLDDAVDEALRDFMVRRKQSMPDIWA